MGSSPTWATRTVTSSWSSQECSPACHAGDRGFKSHRGRSTRWHGTPTGRAAKLKPWCLWVRLPPVLLRKTCVGWALASLGGRNPLASGCAGSTPARRTDNMARWSSGRMRDPHSRGTGSIPVRVTEYSQVAESADARRSERRARKGVGVQVSPWLLDCRSGRCLAGRHEAGVPGSIPGPATCGWA